MELVSILQRLWRRRLFTGAAVAITLVIAIALARGSSPSAGLATSSIVVQTPQSQVVDENATGAENLPARVALLANYMATNTMKDRIAAAAGVPADQLAIIDNELSTPLVPTPLPSRLAGYTPAGGPYTLVVADDDPQLPFVQLQASAPDEPSAARIVEAAERALAAVVAPPGANRKVTPEVSLTSPPTVSEVSSHHSVVKAVLIPLLTLAICCMAIVMIPFGHRPRRGSAGPRTT